MAQDELALYECGVNTHGVIYFFLRFTQHFCYCVNYFFSFQLILYAWVVIVVVV